MALHFSDLTERYYPGQMTEEITYWELFLIKHKIPYQVIYDSDIESGISPVDYKVIIFPYSKLMNESSLKRLSQYQTEGGSLIIFGEFASYDRNNLPVGFERTNKLLGINLIRYDANDLINPVVDISTYKPISLKLNKKSGIGINSKNISVVAENISLQNRVLGEIKDEKSGGSKEIAGIICNPEFKQRFIWSAISPKDIIGEKQNIRSIEQLVLNAIDWFNGNDMLWLSDADPGSAIPTALIFDFQKQLGFSDRVIRLAEKYGIVPLYIIDGSSLDPETIKKFAATGEIALHVNYDDIINLGGLDNHLKNEIFELTKITGKRLSVVYVECPDVESVDLSGLKNLGIKTLLVPHYTLLPEISHGIHIYSINENDNNFFENSLSKYGNTSLTDFYFQNFQSQSFSEGYYIGRFVLHGHCLPDDLYELESFIKLINSSKIIFSSVNDVLDRKEFISGIDYEFLKEDNNSGVLTLVNRSKMEGKYLSFGFSSQGLMKARNVELSSSYGDFATLFNSEQGILNIMIDTFKPGQLIRFNMIFN